ncbi:hypothetical protein COT75_04435 [Candidatus Beckwithbacteria bacterium CG10_big_fil_rev_8_21_14_0_10_34_10]|uniref:DUF5671 domain-containing protein n=1 Tax=Candidatus Beckwithbacteria bacterium CG10_big_fil_rev_8_21_14_0_10_34_10 TaxID=1974495 RepID=A0A2H0W8K5_9BACT|nr:MAG: hypothetical protein COT75_04435 [Candidatus Beckwithbacteria bacterium CG10_big_fil_rev_8_21_14_0_10_34_10]
MPGVTTNINKIVQPESDNSVFEIKDIGLLLSRVLSISLVIGAIIVFAYLLWGAFDWIMSEGDQEKLKSARLKITHAFIGLGILALVWLIWSVVINFLGIGEVSGLWVNFNLNPDAGSTLPAEPPI